MAEKQEEGFIFTHLNTWLDSDGFADYFRWGMYRFLKTKTVDPGMNLSLDAVRKLDPTVLEWT